MIVFCILSNFQYFLCKPNLKLQDLRFLFKIKKKFVKTSQILNFKVFILPKFSN